MIILYIGWIHINHFHPININFKTLRLIVSAPLVWQMMIHSTSGDKRKSFQQSIENRLKHSGCQLLERKHSRNGFDGLHIWKQCNTGEVLRRLLLERSNLSINLPELRAAKCCQEFRDFARGGFWCSPDKTWIWFALNFLLQFPAGRLNSV